MERYYTDFNDAPEALVLDLRAYLELREDLEINIFRDSETNLNLEIEVAGDFESRVCGETLFEISEFFQVEMKNVVIDGEVEGDGKRFLAFSILDVAPELLEEYGVDFCGEDGQDNPYSPECDCNTQSDLYPKYDDLDDAEDCNEADCPQCAIERLESKDKGNQKKLALEMAVEDIRQSLNKLLQAVED